MLPTAACEWGLGRSYHATRCDGRWRHRPPGGRASRSLVRAASAPLEHLAGETRVCDVCWVSRGHAVREHDGSAPRKTLPLKASIRPTRFYSVVPLCYSAISSRDICAHASDRDKCLGLTGHLHNMLRHLVDHQRFGDGGCATPHCRNWVRLRIVCAGILSVVRTGEITNPATLRETAWHRIMNHEGCRAPE